MTVPPPREGDDGILDDVEETLDDVLGENLPQPEAEDPWTRRARKLDAMTSLILAIAAVATAWATFQASQWSGEQSDWVASSSTTRAESIRASGRAAAIEQIDTGVWLSWLEAVSTKDTRRASFLRERFRPGLAAAHGVWVAKATVGPDGTILSVPAGTPFSEPQYVIPDQQRADRLAADAEADLARSQVASDISTKFVIVALVFALVLFFAGIATKFRNPKAQAVLLLLAIAFGIFGLVRMLLLHQLV